MSEIDMQAFVDGMSAKWQKERASTQMTLGGLIEALKAMPETDLVQRIDEPHSYRGYYTDLAFENTGGTMMARQALELCQSCMGQVFEGYKGGDYVMGALTPIWIAKYGCCGDKILGLSDKGTFEIAAYD